MCFFLLVWVAIPCDCLSKIDLFASFNLYGCIMYENDGVQIFQALDPLFSQTYINAGQWTCIVTKAYGTPEGT